MMKRFPSEHNQEQKLPTELIIEIILHRFRFRINSVPDWDRLHDIFIGLPQLRVTRSVIFSRFTYVCPDIIAWRSRLVSTKFTNINTVVVESPSREQNYLWWDNLLGSLTNLTNLQFTNYEKIDINKYTNLVKLKAPIEFNVETLKKLTKLRKLTINKPNLLYADALQFVPELTKLTLDFSQNFCLRKLQSLHTLKINQSYPNATQVIPFLENLTSLSLHQLNPVLDCANFSRLTTLELADSTLDVCLGELTNLTRLCISDQTGGATLDLSWMSNLTNLKSLALALIGDCKPIPKELTNLTALNLDHSNILFSPQEFTNLTYISLVGNFSVRNSQFNEMTQLRHLNVRDNLVVTDENLSFLTNLTRLDISSKVKLNVYSLRKLQSLRHLTTNKGHDIFLENVYIEKFTSYRSRFLPK